MAAPSGALLEIRAGGLLAPGRALLAAVDLSLQRGEVLALLGPGGAGKSSLLRAAVGHPEAAGWQRTGGWHLAVDPASTHFLPQGRPDRAENDRADLVPRLPLLLLDEPRCPSTDDGRAFFAAVLRERAASGSGVLLVTHDLSLARQAADHVVLLVAGSVRASQPAAQFFATAGDGLVARFVAQGNVSLPPAPLPLPSHFRWILADRLAGMGRPGLLDLEERDLEAIAAAGVQILVSLTDQAVAASQLRPFGIEGWHLRIADMGVPPLGPLIRLCRDVNRVLEQGRPVAVHCHAGLGRTGLVLACVLVWRGSAPAAALAQLRATGRGYVQTGAQEQLIARFCREIGRPC